MKKLIATLEIFPKDSNYSCWENRLYKHTREYWTRLYSVPTMIEASADFRVQIKRGFLK